MNTIKQMKATISSVRDLSPSAREYSITPVEHMPFTAGAFVNLFVEHEGKTIRRAFSISSSDIAVGSFTLSVRLSLQGVLTPLLWSTDFTGREIKIMGPLGLNTADKITGSKVFLFGFGIGAGVIKSLADTISRRHDLQSLTIVTGNRSIEEILHKDYFDELARSNDAVSVSYIVSDPHQTIYPRGYIQENLEGYDFSNADVYMCGQNSACTALKEAIEKTNPHACNFFVEDFH
jgi:ring-1,2-phenylacetyl-CoA epoxidase subunit PaaE